MTTRTHIATIGPAHGVRGEVKLSLHLDDPSVLTPKIKLYPDPTTGTPLALRLTRTTNKGALARIDGVTDRTAAEKLRGTKIYMDRADLPETDDGAFYVEDLIGLTAQAPDGTKIGTIRGVDNFGASDLLDIEPPEGPSYYMPFTDDTVSDIDLTNRRITIHGHAEYATLHNSKKDDGE